MRSAKFVVDPGWLAFEPEPSKPDFLPPAGAVDAHCHVFGPGHRFAYAPERKYTPSDAPWDKLAALRNFLRFERNVIVQASCHGTDNRALVDALQRSSGRARGIAAVDTQISDEELLSLHEAGVRGLRFNFVRRLVNRLPFKALERMVSRISDMGWHVVIYFEASDLARLYDTLAALPLPVVIDHMGRVDVGQGVGGKGFLLFLKLLRENPHIWSKVSCPERLSLSGPPDYQDVVPFARMLVETFPDRVLWGSDWPHPNMKSHMPDDGKLVDMIPKIATTASFQHRLLVENPMRLYWPEEDCIG
ncbi:MAG: amidohydrolase family protein [Woeseia sp.]